MRLIPWLAVSLSLALGVSPGTGSALQATSPPPQQTSTQATPSAPAAPATSSKVWVGRYAEYEEFLRTVDIERLADPKVGKTGGTKFAFFKPGGLAARGALRTLRPDKYDGFFESYKSEVAASSSIGCSSSTWCRRAWSVATTATRCHSSSLRRTRRCSRRSTRRSCALLTRRNGTTSSIARTCSPTWSPTST